MTRSFSIPVSQSTKCNWRVWLRSSVRINIYGEQTIRRKGFMKTFDDVLHLKYKQTNKLQQWNREKSHALHQQLMRPRKIDLLLVCNLICSKTYSWDHVQHQIWSSLIWFEGHGTRSRGSEQFLLSVTIYEFKCLFMCRQLWKFHKFLPFSWSLCINVITIILVKLQLWDNFHNYVHSTVF